MKKRNAKNKREKKVLTQDPKSTRSFLSDKPILLFTLKSVSIICIIGAGLLFSDYQGYFNPDQSNNHTIKKWNSYYKFTENNDIDVLLLGNSRLYTGINPKNLSNGLGVNAFILASPGTNAADSYFSLKEALKTAKPKLVIIETYGICDFNPYQLKEQALSDQFKSFYARKNLLTKIGSTPLLFKTDNFFYAWSNTLRNHDFIFKDTSQLAKNKVLINKETIEDSKLYLGRYVCFQTGIQKDILAKYDSLGSPVKGDQYAYSAYAEKYVDKIADLCKKNKIELMFLTLPMYPKHIENYPAWNKTLGRLLNKHAKKWLNMQSPYDSASFSTASFENTYEPNQHMTYDGSLLATYKLIDFIKTNLKGTVPNRKNEAQWRNVFYGQEGYFENNPVSGNDKVNTLLCQNVITNNVVLKEVSVVKPEVGKNNIIMAKIDKKGIDLSKCKLKLYITVVQNNQLLTAEIDLKYDRLYKLSEYYVFKSLIKPIKVQTVQSGQLIYP